MVEYQAPKLVIIGSVVEQTLLVIDGSLDADGN